MTLAETLNPILLLQDLEKADALTPRKRFLIAAAVLMAAETWPGLNEESRKAAQYLKDRADKRLDYRWETLRQQLTKAGTPNTPQMSASYIYPDGTIWNQFLSPGRWQGGTSFALPIIQDIAGPRDIDRAPTADPEAIRIAQHAYDREDWSVLPILADCLEEGGSCDSVLLDHLRWPDWTHLKGCWALDSILGKT